MICEAHEGIWLSMSHDWQLTCQKKMDEISLCPTTNKSLRQHLHRLSRLKIKKIWVPFYILVISCRGEKKKKSKTNEAYQDRLLGDEGQKKQEAGGGGALQETLCHVTGSLIRSVTTYGDTHLAVGLLSPGPHSCIKWCVHSCIWRTER